MAQICLKRKMRRIAFFFLLFSGFSAEAQVTNPAIGSSPWKFINPSPMGYSFTDMSFIDNNVGLAVGVSGISNPGGIMRTTDGGRNWQGTHYKYVTNTGTVSLASFNDVHFVTPSVAYAVGTGGLMVRSTDGGINWSPVATPLTALGRTINAVHFINKDTGYIGGAALNTTNTTNINDAPKVYITRNGGATWDSLVTPFRRRQDNATLSGFNTAEIQRIHFVNDSVGYVSGSCGQVSANYSAILWKIEKNVVKDYSLHRSKFGITATTGTYAPATNTLKGVLGVNDSLVLVSTLNNNIVLRVKTGKNDSTASAVPAVWGNYEPGVYEILVWLNSTATPFPANLVGNVSGQMQQIKKGPDGKIFISAGSRIIHTSDNGTTWNYINNPTPPASELANWGYSALDVTANGRIIIGGPAGLVYDSLPGAPSWQTSYQNTRPLYHVFSDMAWADYCNGVVVGSSGIILSTSNGGVTWQDNTNPVFKASQTYLSGVAYHNVNTMFFVGGPTLYKTADQGITNDAIFTEPSGNAVVNGLAMVGPDRAYLIAYRFSPAVQRAFIYRSLNANSGAVTWDNFSSFPTGNLAPQLRNIKFANQDTGYTCGSRGKVYRTVDAGATWTDISPDTTVNSNGTATYTALSVIDGRTVYVGGSGRRLFRSTDAGVTWTDLTFVVPPAPTPLTNFTSIGTIVMNDANSGYIAAGNILMKTTNAWASWTYDMAPQGMQNIVMYPKIAAPIDNKKLYAMFTAAGPPNPALGTVSAVLMEYGNAAQYNMSTTETVTNASCTNPNGGSITITATGGLTPYTYSINGGAYQTSNVFNGLTQGVKNISIKDGGCQTINKPITVGFTDNMTVAARTDTTVCAGAAVQLDAVAPAGSAYSWSPSGGLSATNIKNPVATTNISTPVNTNITYTVTATLNSCVKTDNVVISIKPSPAVNAGPDKTILAGDEVLLEGSASSSGAQTISWTPTGTILYGGNTFQVKVKPPTTTTYTLTVLDNNGCQSTDNAVVTIVPNCADVKNAFTPNGDGMNDRWIVSNSQACYTKVSVVVFNRYGNEVYRDDNYNNDWDGTYKGKPVADGTYYYVVNFKLINGRIATLKGDVTILR